MPASPHLHRGIVAAAAALAALLTGCAAWGDAVKRAGVEPE